MDVLATRRHSPAGQSHHARSTNIAGILDLAATGSLRYHRPSGTHRQDKANEYCSLSRHV